MLIQIMLLLVIQIVIIHKDNGGLSNLRNAVIDVEKGRFFGFVDSDDWIDLICKNI